MVPATLVGTMPSDQGSGRDDRERAKEARREANARRRAALEVDPRFQAMKQARKDQLRAAYAKAKERRKAIAAELKQQRRERRASERAERDAALMKLIHPATGGEKRGARWPHS